MDRHISLSSVKKEPKGEDESIDRQGEVKEEPQILDKKEKAKREKEAKKKAKEEKKKEAKKAKEIKKKAKKSIKDEEKENEEPELKISEESMEEELSKEESLLDETIDDAKPALPSTKVKPPKKEDEATRSRLKNLLNWKEPKTEPKSTPAELSTESLCHNTRVPRPQPATSQNRTASSTNIQLTRSLSRLHLSASAASLLNIEEQNGQKRPPSPLENSFADFSSHISQAPLPRSDLLFDLSDPFLDLAQRQPKPDLFSRSPVDVPVPNDPFLATGSTSANLLFSEPPRGIADSVNKIDAFSNDPFLDISTRTSSPLRTMDLTDSSRDPFCAPIPNNFGGEHLSGNLRATNESFAKDLNAVSPPSPIGGSRSVSREPFLETSSRTTSPAVTDINPAISHPDLSLSFENTSFMTSFDTHSSSGSRLPNQIAVSDDQSFPGLVPDVFVDPFLDFQSIFQKPEPKPEKKIFVPHDVFSDLNPLKKNTFVPRDEFFKDQKRPPKKSLVDLTNNSTNEQQIAKEQQDPWAAFLS